MNVLDLISQDVRLTKRGKEYVGLCPFHTEKTPSFSVSEGRNLYYCFSCGEGGDSISYLRKKRGLTFREAAQQVGKELTHTDRFVLARERAVKARLLTEYWQWEHAQLRVWTEKFRELSAEVEVATIGYRATVRNPHLYSEAEKEYWERRLVQLYDALPSVEHTCDILTYDRHAGDRFVYFTTSRGERDGR